MDDLNLVAPVPNTIAVAGRDLDVSPLKVGELAAFMRAVSPVLDALAKGDLMDALTHDIESVIQAAALGARVEMDWIEAQEADALLEIAVAVVEVNADFFARRIAPRLADAAQRMAGRLDGLSSTPVSAPPDLAE